MGYILCHTVTQGFFHQYHFEKKFHNVENFAAGAPSPLLNLRIFKCRLSRKKNPGI